ncbi:MAG: hypothetical protein PUI05_03635 [Peptoniphilaceae bacterium]|nr:hypothetical protein [Peptoniphilaceae bacterium]
MKKEIDKKVFFNKGGAGGTTARLSLPSERVADMKLNENNNYVTLKYDEENKKITIKNKK